LLTLLQHGDSQFPSGAFAYSSGLEGLFADGHADIARFDDLLATLVDCRWASFDRVALTRAWRAAHDLNSLAALDIEIEASLFAPAERGGSVRAGKALLTTHLRLATPGAAALRQALDCGRLRGHRVLMEGVLWQGLGLSAAQARALSGYAFTNGLCTAAVRLGRLGALTQQGILTRLVPRLARWAAHEVAADQALGAFSPLTEIAMMRRGARVQGLFAT
jgi:urease accessory protein